MGTLFTVDGTTGNINTAGSITATGAITSSTGDITLQNQHSVIFQDTELTPKSVTLRAPTTLTSTYTLKWPLLQGGAATVLSNDGSGNLAWAPPTAATNPAGTTGAVQFNSGGVFGGDATKLFWDATSFRLGINTNTPATTLDLGPSGNLTASNVASSTATFSGGMTSSDFKGNGYTGGTSLRFAPTGNSTVAAVFQNAGETVTILDVDSTNHRVGVLTETPSVELDVVGSIKASVTITSPSITLSSFLNLPALSTPPASPVAGRVYFDTTIPSGTATGSIQVYDGTSWHTVTTV